MAPGSGVGDAVGEGVVTGADCMAPGSGVRNGVGEVVGEGTGAGPLFC